MTAPRSSSTPPETCMTRPDGECVSEGPCIHGIPATLEGIEAGLIALVPPKDRSAKMPAMDAIMYAVEQLASPPPPSPTQETTAVQATHRWNVEETDRGIRVCRGLHDKAYSCEWEYYAPATPSSPETPAEERGIEESLDILAYWHRVAVGFALRTDHPDYPDTESSLKAKRQAENQFDEKLASLLALYTRQREEYGWVQAINSALNESNTRLLFEKASLSSQLERLKADSLTGEEVGHIQWATRAAGLTEDIAGPIISKLRRLSSDSGTGGEK